ncbi:MAG: DUF2911 domain-containing protein [Bacteroidota bacterium]
MRRIIASLLFFGIFGLHTISAQNISLPPSGGNQVCEISQYMGLVKVSVNYSSPDVTANNGDSRKGQIWGKLVPYGLSPNTFGTAKNIPWRAGANKNTIVTFSHDVLVQGRPIQAGSYGLHMIPVESGAWTVIFSNNNNAWGSYFYDAKDDALRVEATPEPCAYQEYLTFDFTVRKQATSTLAMKWDELSLPITIEVPNLNDLYIEEMTAQLQDIPGYSWQNLNQAAQFCLSNNTHLDKGMEWANLAVNGAFVGQANFSTLSTKAMLEAKLEKGEELEATLKQAMDHPSASVLQIHSLGRQLIGMGRKTEALMVFQTNAEKYPETWPVNIGLARGHSAVGNFKEALKFAKKARKNVPEGDSLNKNNVEKLIKMLKKEQDIN